MNLYITYSIDNELILTHEKENGYIEYKRTLIGCNNIKIEKYATQMKWRISENIKNHYAIYYIGIDDNGEIIGLKDIDENIRIFINITKLIKASICYIKKIEINEKIILKIMVKIKKALDNYDIFINL